MHHSCGNKSEFCISKIYVRKSRCYVCTEYGSTKYTHWRGYVINIQERQIKNSKCNITFWIPHVCDVQHAHQCDSDFPVPNIARKLIGWCRFLWHLSSIYLYSSRYFVYYFNNHMPELPMSSLKISRDIINNSLSYLMAKQIRRNSMRIRWKYFTLLVKYQISPAAKS